MNDVLCWGQHISGTGSAWQRGSSSFCPPDRLIDTLKVSVSQTPDTWMIKAVCFERPLVAKKSSIAFTHLQRQPIPFVRDKIATGSLLSALMKSTILRADGQSRGKRARGGERAFQRLSTDSMWVSVRDQSFFSTPAGWVGVVSDSPVFPLCYCVLTVK